MKIFREIYDLKKKSCYFWVPPRIYKTQTNILKFYTNFYYERHDIYSFKDQIFKSINLCFIYACLKKPSCDDLKKVETDQTLSELCVKVYGLVLMLFWFVRLFVCFRRDSP